MKVKKHKSNRKLRYVFISFLMFFMIGLLPAQSTSFPQGSSSGRTTMTGDVSGVDIPLIDLSIKAPETNQEVAFSIQLMLLLTILSLAPSILILVTCFLRFSIVLDFIKRALSLQQVPPTAVLNGIAFFMTLFIMWPTFSSIYTNAKRNCRTATVPLVFYLL